MSKRPSEMSVVDRIFYDIKVHGIESVLKNKEFYQNYKPLNLSQDDVSGRSEQLKAFDELFDYAWNLAQHPEEHAKLNDIKERF